MAQRSPYLTIGQMAKLHYINRKTLLFYDQIGLFSPEHTGANGYRYYTYRQCLLLEKILFLRRLDIPLEDIRRQLQTGRAAAGADFLAAHRQRNAEHIRRLQQYDKILRRKEAELRAALAAPLGKVELRTLPAEKYFVSRPSKDDQQMTQFFSDLLAQAGGQHLYYYSFGGIVPLSGLLAGQLELSRYFVVYRAGMHTVRPTLRAAGQYLAVNCQDQPHARAGAYRSLLAYAQQQGLQLCGDAFERQLIDSFCTSDPAEYLVEITVPVQPAATASPAASA